MNVIQTIINCIHKHCSMFPVRCFTCSKVIGRTAYLEKYKQGLKEGKPAHKILDDMNIRRECCRTRFLCSMSIWFVTTWIQYQTDMRWKKKMGQPFRRHAKALGNHNNTRVMLFPMNQNRSDENNYVSNKKNITHILTSVRRLEQDLKELDKQIEVIQQRSIRS